RRRRGSAALSGGAFAAAQLHAADLPGDRLGELGEFEAADAFVRGEVLAGVAEDLLGGGAVGLPSGGEADVGLGYGEAQRVGRGDDGGLGDGFVLEQDAFELEGREAVGGGF